MKLLYSTDEKGADIMKRPRRNHSPAFKAKVALDALRGEATVVQLAERYDVHPNHITAWKQQLLERAAEVFGGVAQAPDSERRVRGLHEKIGELTVERDFLANALGRAPGRNDR